MGSRAVSEVKSGLRLGIGVVSFVSGAAVLAVGLARVAWSAAPPTLVLRADPVGWIAVACAGLVLFLTAGVWWQFLGGMILLGSVKTVIVIITGRDVFPPRAQVERLLSGELLAFCAVSLVLMFRFQEHKPATIDRVALTAYLACLVYSLLGKGLSVSGWGLAAALVCLLIPRVTDR